MCRLHKVRDLCLHTNTHSERLTVSVMNWFSPQLIGCFVQAICVYMQVCGGCKWQGPCCRFIQRQISSASGYSVWLWLLHENTQEASKYVHIQTFGATAQIIFYLAPDYSLVWAIWQLGKKGINEKWQEFKSENSTCKILVYGDDTCLLPNTVTLMSTDAKQN